jgi:flagellar motor switch protein FliM
VDVISEVKDGSKFLAKIGGKNGRKTLKVVKIIFYADADPELLAVAS